MIQEFLSDKRDGREYRYFGRWWRKTATKRETVTLMYFTDASTRKTTNALKRVKSLMKTIRDKDICLKRDIETWVVLSFVSPNPIVSFTETETTTLCIFWLTLYRLSKKSVK